MKGIVAREAFGKAYTAYKGIKTCPAFIADGGHVHPFRGEADFLEQRTALSSVSAFTYPGFQRYWAARLCVTLAIQMQAVAIGWQIYDLTRRPLDLGPGRPGSISPGRSALALVTGHVCRPL